MHLSPITHLQLSHSWLEHPVTQEQISRLRSEIETLTQEICDNAMLSQFDPLQLRIKTVKLATLRYVYDTHYTNRPVE